MSSQQQQHAQRHPLPTTLHVVLPHDPDTIFVVSKCAVISTPPQRPRAGRIGSRTVVACRAFAGTGVCELGPRGEANCPFAHVMLDPVQSPRFHAHRAPPGGWASLAAVPYERFPPGGRFSLQAPNTPGCVLETLRPEECLRTRALEAHAGTKLTHCGHWLVKGSCHYGAACKFVHAALPTPAAMSAVASRPHGSEPPLVATAEASGTSLPGSRRGEEKNAPSVVNSTGTSSATRNVPVESPQPDNSSHEDEHQQQHHPRRCTYPFRHDPYRARPRHSLWGESPRA